MPMPRGNWRRDKVATLVAGENRARDKVATLVTAIIQTRDTVTTLDYRIHAGNKGEKTSRGTR